MINVFLDTSILLASLRSPQGGSSELLRYAVVGTIEASVSDDVIDEVARHVHEVDPALRSLLLKFLAAIPFRVISVTPQEVQRASSFTAAKDSTIVAAANKSGAAYLVTLDKRHLLDKKADIEPNVGFQIVRPEAILSILSQEK
ncbi:MAG: putative toxin-antitoxin system toxin component, PIN family [Caldilineaceae bacterium]|nr:putative toxin-antitoxin system toxin component, PIN family [Caldilineaceae bacterium]